MKKICIFDVNETLLDLAILDTDFKDIFGSEVVRKEWFGQFIQSAFVSIITDTYKPFGLIGSAAFDMIAEKYGIPVSDETKVKLLGKIVQLPPHPEVAPALDKLKKHGFQMATLTNSTQEIADTQLNNAGIGQYFDRILSTDTVKRLKPAKEAYEMTAQEFGVDISNVRLIAAHAWDITGALSAGCSAAFVARPGMVLSPLTPRPDIIGMNLTEVVDKIIANES